MLKINLLSVLKFKQELITLGFYTIGQTGFYKKILWHLNVKCSEDYKAYTATVISYITYDLYLLQFAEKTISNSIIFYLNQCFYGYYM